MSVYKDKGEPMRLSDAFAYRRAFRFWIATAKGHKAAYAAMRQRAEEAETNLADLDTLLLGSLAALGIPTPVEGYRAAGWAFLKGHLKRATEAKERAEEALRHLYDLNARGVFHLPDEHYAAITNAAEVLSSHTADASSVISKTSSDPYSGELGNINLRNLAARMHAALGLLKRQGCYHPAMDSMREEGFRHGLNIGDVEPEDPSADASTMGGEKCLCCGAEMDENWPGFTTRRGRICMGCEGKFVTVYSVSIDGSTLYDNDISSVLCLLQEELQAMDAGDSFEVVKRQMPALQYFDLPEHQGF